MGFHANHLKPFPARSLGNIDISQRSDRARAAWVSKTGREQGFRQPSAGNHLLYSIRRQQLCYSSYGAGGMEITGNNYHG